MSTKIEEREHRGIAVLALTGRITDAECHGELKAAVRNLVERGRKRIVLDLEAVPFLDSAGLGEIVSSYATVTQLGGSLKLTNANSRVVDVIELARLTGVLLVTELAAEIPSR